MSAALHARTGLGSATGTLLLGVAALACSTLTARGQRVRVLDSAPVSDNGAQRSLSDCRFIGPITTHTSSTKPGSPLTGNFAVARSNARIDLRNKAAKLGADTIANYGSEDDFFGVTAKGDAYDCGSGARSQDGDAGVD